MTESSELSELFADVAPDIQKSIRELGWHSPTPVQAAAIPRMRAGGDLIVQAQTGSGKTGAFGIPLVEAIDTASKETQAIVLLPTRELANQVAVELEQLGCHRGVRTLPIYGGVAYGPQLEGLEKGAHIIVGTPGRILDHLKNGRMDLSGTKVLVLDEADEMLSLGFWPDMKEVASFLPKKRQSHLFSATMPEKVRSLSRFFLTDAEDVTIEVEGGSPQRIEHFYYLAPASEKEALLARIIEYEDPESAIIFCNTKADVRFITAYLAKRGLNIDQISGDLAQAAREKAIAKIKAGKLRFLVATDVAARGIDISDLAYVINYTTSDSPEVYVHRTGRTGRAGKSGVAISIVSGLDIGNFKHMQVVSGIKIVEKKAPTERDILRRRKRRAAQPKQESKQESETASGAHSEDTDLVADEPKRLEAPGATAAAAPRDSDRTESRAQAADTPAPRRDEEPASSRRRRRRSSSSESGEATDARPKARRSRSADRTETDTQEIERLKARAGDVLAALSPADTNAAVDRLLPFIREATETDEGQRELARLCAALLTEAESASETAASPTSAVSRRRARRAASSASESDEAAPSESRSARRGPAADRDRDEAAGEAPTRRRRRRSSASADDAPSRADARSDSDRPPRRDADADRDGEAPRRRSRRRSSQGADKLMEDDASRAERPPRARSDERSGSDRPHRRRRSSGGR